MSTCTLVTTKVGALDRSRETDSNGGPVFLFFLVLNEIEKREKGGGNTRAKALPLPFLYNALPGARQVIEQKPCRLPCRHRSRCSLDSSAGARPAPNFAIGVYP